jgi:hypothetical protein
MRELEDRTVAQSFSPEIIRQGEKEVSSFRSVLENEARKLENSINGVVSIREDKGGYSGTSLELVIIAGESAEVNIIKRAMEETFHQTLDKTIHT